MINNHLQLSFEMEIVIDEGGYYTIDVYYDILDDVECLHTKYSFRSKEIAEQFVEQVPFVCGDIEYEESPRTDDGHATTHPFRPVFTTLEDALVDAKEFNKYGDEIGYKYRGRVFKENISLMEIQYDKNIIKKLKKENEDLKKKLILLETELKTYTK